MSVIKWITSGAIAAGVLYTGLIPLSMGIPIPNPAPLSITLAPPDRHPQRVKFNAPIPASTPPHRNPTGFASNAMRETASSGNPMPAQLPSPNTSETPATPPPQNQSTIPIPYSTPKPRYPELARKQGIEGSVGVQLTINPDGTVGSTQIIRPSPSPLLDRAAQNAVKQWRFAPTPTKTIEVSIEFKLNSL